MVDFAGARDEGLANLEKVIDQYEHPLELPRADLREYLTDNISFDLDDEMRAGLELYYNLAWKHGIISEVRPLDMI
jgi:predicted solute-binding protein